MFQIDNLSNSQPIRCGGKHATIGNSWRKGAHRSLFRDNHKIKSNFGFLAQGQKGSAASLDPINFNRTRGNAAKA